MQVSPPERGNLQFSGVLRIGSPDASRSGPEIGVLREGGADLTVEGVGEGAGQRLVQAGGLRVPGIVDAPPPVIGLGRVLLVAAAVPFLDKGETVPFAEAAGGGVLP
ncbi:hypothetical protein ACIG5D_33290 [Microbispora rosea]|uniref:hypothetical protein n=1 Tax=Microbispora rosea TaxID=58117 RepID=UPI0037C68451